MERDIKYLNAFNMIPGVGPAALRVLKNHFGSFEDAWAASESSLAGSGISKAAGQGIAWKRQSLSPDRELEKLIREQMWIITEESPQYPPLLKETAHAPLVLYGKGNISLLSSKEFCIGVVGTRRPTGYGKEAAGTIVRDLVQAGVAIVSGLALGIDAQAHETTLQEKGKTIAVLGSGIDETSLFPQEHRGLARRITDGGGVILSEYALGAPPLKENFPQRNRIIAGLSKGVLVVEARERSGALITARLALEENRDVFAIPGSIFSHSSQGPNMLIQQGAKLVFSARSILDEYGIEYTGGDTNAAEKISGDEEKILSFLDEPLHVNAVKEKTGLHISVILTSLSLLELKGAVRNLGQDIYQKT